MNDVETNGTAAIIPADVQNQNVQNSREHNDMVYDMYIEFCAAGGYQVSEDGVPMRISVQQFCDTWGVERKALWRRRKADENFDDEVTRRRAKVITNNRIGHIWNGLILQAMAGKPEPAKLVLANFDPNFRMPTEKVEHEAGGGLADLLDRGRERVVVVEEGEVVEGS